eukprot:gene6350-biopygen13629
MQSTVSIAVPSSHLEHTDVVIGSVYTHEPFVLQALHFIADGLFTAVLHAVHRLDEGIMGYTSCLHRQAVHQRLPDERHVFLVMF